MKRKLLLWLAAVVLLVAACGTGRDQKPTPTARGQTKGGKMAIDLKSPAFEEGSVIPTRYTCDGQDISPPLSWSSVPDDTRSLALVTYDPDAPGGTFVHWVLFNVPPDARELAEDIPDQERLPNGAAQGVNGFGKVGYMGPCPPSGTHRYFFEIYALDTTLDLGAGTTREDLDGAIQGHVLAEGRLMGTYQRR